MWLSGLRMGRNGHGDDGASVRLASVMSPFQCVRRSVASRKNEFAISRRSLISGVIHSLLLSGSIVWPVLYR